MTHWSPEDRVEVRFQLFLFTSHGYNHTVLRVDTVPLVKGSQHHIGHLLVAELLSTRFDLTVAFHDLTAGIFNLRNQWYRSFKLHRS